MWELHRARSIASVGLVIRFAFVLVFLLGLRGEAQNDPPKGGQETEQGASKDGEPNAGESAIDGGDPIQTLTALHQSIEAKRKAIEAKRAELANEKGEQRRSELNAEIKTLSKELNEFETAFQTVATGIDVPAFLASEKSSFDLQKEVVGLLEPLVSEIKSATEAPQQIHQLNKTVAYLRDRASTARRAIKALTAFQSNPEAAAIRAEVETRLTEWRDRLTTTRNRIRAAEAELAQRRSGQKPVLDTLQTWVASFFRTRGLSLLLAIAAFIVVMFGLRLLHTTLRRMPGFRRKSQKRTFWSRLVSVIYQVFIFVAAFLAAMAVLFIREDWSLLGLVILFLIGIAWASKQAFPKFVEEIRLVLNLGTVREFERLVYNGVPWRVSRLHFYTKLTNPALTGGLVRLPARELLGMHSRPHSEREEWFPTDEGDWVLLPGGGRGEVVLQTPEFVQLRTPGKSIITYPTGDFIELAAKNISHGFRLKAVFGIDYKHQAICTDEVPAKMKKHLNETIHSIVDREHVVKVNVEFSSAAASSLDFTVLADFSGEVAKDIEVIDRAVARLLVDLCNREGWEIPFTQITVHNAA